MLKGFLTMSLLVGAVAAAALGAPPPEQVEVWKAGAEGYHTFRIPSLIVTKKGTLLAFCEGRKGGRGDSGAIDTVLKRSRDGGRTWDPMQVVAADGANTMGNPCPVLDRDTGVVWLLLTRNLGQDTEQQIRDRTARASREVWVTKSADDGATWSKPVEITSTTKDPNWTWYATGPGVGIQLRSGRLLIPCDHTTAETKINRSHAIYSDDHGATWKLGGTVGDQTNECQAVELKDGTVQINMRSYHGKNRRAISHSKDGGLTWSPVELHPELVEPVCQASLIALPSHDLLFANPASTRREKLTVRLSHDGGKTWPVSRELHAGPAAYSCLAALPDGTLACLYERGDANPYEKITLARFPLSWLTAK